MLYGLLTWKEQPILRQQDKRTQAAGANVAQEAGLSSAREGIVLQKETCAGQLERGEEREGGKKRRRIAPCASNRGVEEKARGKIVKCAPPKRAQGCS